MCESDVALMRICPLGANNNTNNTFKWLKHFGLACGKLVTYWDIRCSTRHTKVYNFNPLHSSNLFYRRLSRCSLIRNFTIGISRVNSSTLSYWWLNISMSLKHKHSQCACIMLTKCYFYPYGGFFFFLLTAFSFCL